jgi:hypothetical protein
MFFLFASVFAMFCLYSDYALCAVCGAFILLKYSVGLTYSTELCTSKYSWLLRDRPMLLTKPECGHAVLFLDVSMSSDDSIVETLFLAWVHSGSIFTIRTVCSHFSLPLQRLWKTQSLCYLTDLGDQLPTFMS